nr:uncharacterized protein LOC129166975 [Nothobranchius furzeri]
MEHPNLKKAQNGTLILKASDEAKAVGPQRQGYRAKQPEEVEARAHVASEGSDVNNATVVLSRWKVQFGTYQGKTFHWLLQNDVGYAVMVVASHQKEREGTGSQSPLMANKDAFTRYSLAYPEFAEAVRFRQAFEEARVKSLQPGQEGQALVGFGDFKFESQQSLYDSKDPKTIRWLLLLIMMMILFIITVIIHLVCKFLSRQPWSPTNRVKTQQQLTKGRRQLQARRWRTPSAT